MITLKEYYHNNFNNNSMIGYLQEYIYENKVRLQDSSSSF